MTVLYCVARIDGPAALPSGGLPEAEAARALDLPGGLTAIVATVPDALYAPDIVNAKLRDMDWVSSAALGHERLLEAVMRTASAVLPMKLLTLFSGDARLLQDLSKQRRALAKAATQVEGCEEYGLRIVALDGPAPAAAGERPASGTEFLARKKQARDEARAQAARRAAFAREAYDALAGASRAALMRPLQGDEAERPLADAAFLVAADQKTAFGRAAAALETRAAGEHCLFKLTGPWPPYHFVETPHAAS